MRSAERRTRLVDVTDRDRLTGGKSSLKNESAPFVGIGEPTTWSKPLDWFGAAPIALAGWSASFV